MKWHGNVDFRNMLKHLSVNSYVTNIQVVNKMVDIISIHIVILRKYYRHLVSFNVCLVSMHNLNNGERLKKKRYNMADEDARGVVNTCII